MSIQKGDSMPNAQLFDIDDQGAPRSLSASERLAGKRIVLFEHTGFSWKALQKAIRFAYLGASWRFAGNRLKPQGESRWPG